MKTALAILMMLALAPSALARTQPNDVVRVIKAKDAGLDWQVYDKKFSELKFDKKTLDRIHAAEAMLAQGDDKNYGRYRLTHVRIVAEDVQYLIFHNGYGDVHMIDLDDPNFSCGLTFSGNGFSRCSN